MQRVTLRLLLIILLAGSTGDLSAQLPTPAPAGPLFQERPFGPRPAATPTPERKKSDSEAKQPIPLAWILGGTGIGLLAIVALLYGSARRWRSSNLFDRQYRFPIVEEPALRFGAKKCGGHLAKVQLGLDPLQGEQASKTKDA